MVEIMMENLMPAPTMRTTPTTIPEHSRMTPVETMLRDPWAMASRMSWKPIRVFLLSQEDTTMAPMPTQAAKVGVNP